MALATIKREPETTKSPLQVCRLCLSEEILDDVFGEEGLQQWISEYLSITVSSEDIMSRAICTICRCRLIEFHQFHVRCQEVQDVLQFLIQNEDIETECEQLFLKDQLKYGCIDCGKMFVLRQHLDQHKQTHTKVIEQASEEQLTSDEVQQPQTHVARVKVDPAEYVENNVSQNMPLAFISSELAKKRMQNLAKSRKSHKKNRRRNVEKERTTGLVDMIDIEEVKIEAHTDDDDGKLTNGMVENPVSISNAVDADKSNKLIDKAKSDYIKRSDLKLSGSGKKKTEECDICHRKYANTLLLWSHRKLAHGPKNYKCDVCGSAFALEQDLKRHNSTNKHLKKLQKLSVKNKLTESDHNAKGNAVASEPSVDAIERDNFCSICNRTFKRQCQFNAHMRSHEIDAQKSSDTEGTDNEEVMSDASVYTSNSDQPLEVTPMVSDSSVHSSNDQSLGGNEVKSDKPWKCVSCHRSYDTEKQLKNHKRFHAPKKYLCPVCGKPFVKMYALQTHIPTHNAVRDWPRNRNVSTKRNKHLERPHKCDICQSSYRTSVGLIGHKKQVHGPKNHVCHLCSYRFATRKDLTRHIHTHYRT